MTREEFEIVIENGSTAECIIACGAFIDSLEKNIFQLQYDKKLQYDTDQMCQKILMSEIEELKKQNKMLWECLKK